jgi:HSP20 family protein
VGYDLAPLRRSFGLRDDLSQVLQSFSNVFGFPWEAGAEVQPHGLWPAVDVQEGKDTLTIKAELPGLKKEDINISLHDGVLTLSGERKGSAESQNGGMTRSERWFGRFQRSFTLPGKVDTKNIPATYTDGILTITLTKAEEAKPKQIKVQFN